MCYCLLVIRMSIHATKVQLFFDCTKSDCLFSRRMYFLSMYFWVGRLFNLLNTHQKCYNISLYTSKFTEYRPSIYRISTVYLPCINRVSTVYRPCIYRVGMGTDRYKAADIMHTITVEECRRWLLIRLFDAFAMLLRCFCDQFSIYFARFY